MTRMASRVALALAAGWVVAGCGSSDSGGGTTAPTAGVSQFISAVGLKDGSATATLHSGAPPSAGSGPTISADTAGAAIPGGTKIVSISSSGQFTRIIVAVDGQDGYYELTIPTATTTSSIIVTLAQTLSASFDLQVGTGDAAAVGSYDSVPLSFTNVGTGEVQVSLSWDTETDVDLHVLDPSGEEIYWLNRTAASGGELDLDSNPGCYIDNVNNENITWASGRAPRGTYKVLVDYFRACSIAATTHYAVTVNVTGRAPQTLNGTFTQGMEDQGDACLHSADDATDCGTLITTFTY
jgi:hypothetical protein